MSSTAIDNIHDAYRGGRRLSVTSILCQSRQKADVQYWKLAFILHVFSAGYVYLFWYRNDEKCIKRCFRNINDMIHHVILKILILTIMNNNT